jgi:uridylate kinase
MNTIEKKKTFDSVAFMRAQRNRLTEMLLKMTKEEIVEYFHKKMKETTIKPIC